MELYNKKNGMVVCPVIQDACEDGVVEVESFRDTDYCCGKLPYNKYAGAGPVEHHCPVKHFKECPFGMKKKICDDIKINPSTTDMDPVEGYGCEHGRGVFRSQDEGEEIEICGGGCGPITVHHWDKDNNFRMPLDQFKKEHPDLYRERIAPLLKNEGIKS